MNVVGNNLVQKIKSEYGVSYDLLKVDDILNSKNIVKDNKVVNIESLIDEVLEKHTNLIINRLKGIQEYNISKHIYIGGGALRLSKYLKQDLDKDTIYINSKAFYKIGVEKFGEN